MEPKMKALLAASLMVLAMSLAGCETGASKELKKGWKLILAKDYASARDQYEATLVKYPDNPYALLNLGFVSQQLGDYRSARKNYEAAIIHGGSAEVSRVVEGDNVTPRTTTVADKARENLQTLPK
jgi:tetratricopeptide (TPR) repeat protein